MLRYAPRFHWKNSQKKSQKKFKDNFQKKIPKKNSRKIPKKKYIMPKLLRMQKIGGV
jgi:hypothetical protein